MRAFSKRPAACALVAAFFLFSTTGGAFGERIGRLGYVVSEQDRARADALYQEGFATFQAGDYPKALGLIDQADRLKPDQPDGWNLRGMIYLKQKAYEKAREAFARAAALDPALWAAQFNLAETAFQQKDYPRARKGFEHLLAQTDRFKQGSRWELIEYKAFLCCLLGGDAAGANERLTRLPVTGAATPARLYAEAALAYRNKKAAGAQQAIAAAQAKFPPTVNDLFADSLVQAGWEAPPPAALFAGDPGLPPGVTLATNPAPGMSAPAAPYYVVDPKVEAAAAEPLPLPDAGVHPIVGKLNPALSVEPGRSMAEVPKGTPGRVMAVQATLPAPQSTPDVELEHKDLLLIE